MADDSRPVRIAVVNDYELVVAGIAAVLQPFADRVEVVELDSRQPVVSDVDVVLYDSFGQVQGDQVDLARLMAGTHAKLVIFSWNTGEDLVDRAIERGASGYVAKSVGAEDLVEAIEKVHAGAVVRPGADDDGDTFGRWPGAEHGLSPRESEVLALITQGLSNREISELAYIGVNTVKTYVRTLYRKIGVNRRAQAVAWGMSHGFSPDRSRHLHGEPAREG